MKFALVSIRIRKVGFLTEPANSHNPNTFFLTGQKRKIPVLELHKETVSQGKQSQPLNTRASYLS